MTETFFIKRGDTSPAIRFELEPTGVNLAGAIARFQMRLRGGAMSIDAPALVTIPTGTPTVGYDWRLGDTEEAGQFEAEFQITYADGTVETFPNSGFLVIRIAEDVR